MRELSPLDLIRAHDWTSAFFTTYSLSLAYFEAVILDELARRGAPETVILADIAGVRTALSEYGARHAGRSYRVEPVAVNRDCRFHAKMMALTSPEEAHLFIGSGNLTVGGWGANLECGEHLHPSFAADAFHDAADFLEALGKSPVARHAAVTPCTKLAFDLRRHSSTGSRTGNIRLISNLEHSIFDQLARLAEDLGGAKRLAIISPFFDTGVAIDKLCSSLGLDQVSLHAHPTSTVGGQFGGNWPENAENRIAAVTIEPFVSHPRPLHAKVFEILCRKGRLVMSGSANATSAGLTAGRNIELSVIRIQRDRSVGWRMAPTTPPSCISAMESRIDPEHETGVLRAIMSGDALQGEIMTKFPAGDAQILHLTVSGPKLLAATIISQEGNFSISARGFEAKGWSAERLVIRVESAVDHAIAEGFVFFPDVSEIGKHAGGITVHLLAILSCTETPKDVAAVLSWFHDHPEYLRARVSGGGAGEVPAPAPNATVAVADLLGSSGTAPRSGVLGSAGTSAGWQRFMNQVFASFRHPQDRITGALAEPDGGETTEDEDPAPTESHPDTEGARRSFDRLFVRLVNENGTPRDIGIALYLTQYVCKVLGVEAVDAEKYLSQLISALTPAEALEADKEAFAAAIIVLADLHKRRGGPEADLRPVRRRLLQLGVRVSQEPPDISSAQGFARILVPDMDMASLWTEICGVRTFQEEVALFRAASPGSPRVDDFPALSSLPEWSELVKANTAGGPTIHYVGKAQKNCPSCNYQLPTGPAAQLRSRGVGRASSCCNAILMSEEI